MKSRKIRILSVLLAIMLMPIATLGSLMIHAMADAAAVMNENDTGTSAPVFVLEANDLMLDLNVSTGIASTTVSATGDYTTILLTNTKDIDPYCNQLIANPTVGGRYIAFKYRAETTESVMVEFFLSSNGPIKDANNQVHAELTCDGEWYVGIIDTATMNPAVYDGAKLDVIRFDPIANIASGGVGGNLGTDTIDYAWIGMFNTEEDIAAYDESHPLADESDEPEDSEPATPVIQEPVFIVDAVGLVFNGGVNACNGIVSALLSEDGTYNIITVNSDDPVCGNLKPGQTEGGRYIGFKYRVTTDQPIVVEFFIDSNGGIASADQMINAPLTTDGEWHVGVIDTSTMTSYDGSKIAALRFDPMNPATAGGTLGTNVIDYAWVGMFHSEADVYAYNENNPLEPPVETDPVETDPVETDPVETDPVETDPEQPNNSAFVLGANDLMLNLDVSTGIASTTVSATGDYTTILLTNTKDIDPYCNYLIANPTVGGRYIAFKYRAETTESVMVEFFLSSNGPIKDANNQVHAALTCDGKWYVGIIDTATMNPAVYDGAKLDVIRFDPIANIASGGVGGNLGTDTIDYAWIGMFNTEEDIYAYHNSHLFDGESALEPPVETDPTETDPTETDPTETDPTETDPAETDPTETDPTETDPAETDPTETDPAETDPTETDPTETDPATEPVDTDKGCGSVLASSMAFLAIVGVAGFAGLCKRKKKEE